MIKKLKNTGSLDNQISFSNEKLFTDLSHLIEQSRQQVAMQANSILTILFWQVGKRINDDILQNQRAEYGKQIVSTLSAQLENLYGRNFTERNVRRMMQFAESFPDIQIVSPLATQLSWSHFIELLPLKSYEAKLFYAQLSIEGKLEKENSANKSPAKLLKELKLPIYNRRKTKTFQSILLKTHTYWISLACKMII